MTISGDIFMFFLGMLAVIFMGMSYRNLLYTLCSSMIWFVLLMWLFTGDNPPLPFGEPWTKILAFVFLVLSILPWLTRMDVEIGNETRGKRWRTWGPAPKEKGPTNYEAYRDELRRRTRR